MVASIPGKTRFSQKNYSLHVRLDDVPVDEVVCVDYKDYLKSLEWGLDVLESMNLMVDEEMCPNKEDVLALEKMGKLLLRLIRNNYVPAKVYSRLDRDLAWADKVIEKSKKLL